MPKIFFGPGEFDRLGRIIGALGKTALIVTSGGSPKRIEKWNEMIGSLRNNSIKIFHTTVDGEPSPDFVDAATAEFRKKNVDVVLAVGGGGVVDAGKAVSAMLTQKSSVCEYLEGIGKGTHNGEKVPFIAVPTTAGTGSETTKNAVLSKVGPDGFKRSIRHDNFVPDVAVVDPELALTCPPPVTAACGMDAFTQLLESYVSTNANSMTDSLALGGMERARGSLVPAYKNGSKDIEARSGMAYAAMISGITLANAGLGVIHGFAGPVGGFFKIPHGVVCGTLAGAATRATVEKLLEEKPGDIGLKKYAKAGAMLTGTDAKDVAGCARTLCDKIDEWTEKLEIPRLGEYGIRPSDLENIAAASGNKYNPIRLEKNEMKEVLSSRL